MLVCVDPAEVRLAWPSVRHLIEVAMRRSDLDAFEAVERDVLNGAALLWLVDGGGNAVAAVVTQIVKAERKVCVIVACGGLGMRHWLGDLSQIEAYAKAEGCAATRIIGRTGWERVLPDYKQKRVILEKDLA